MVDLAVCQFICEKGIAALAKKIQKVQTTAAENTFSSTFQLRNVKTMQTRTHLKKLTRPKNFLHIKLLRNDHLPFQRV